MSKHPESILRIEPVNPLESQNLTRLQRAFHSYFKQIGKSVEDIKLLLDNSIFTERANFGENVEEFIKRLCLKDFEKGPVECTFPEVYTHAVKMSILVPEERLEIQGVYKIRVRQMTESHRKTYWVEITNPTYPADPTGKIYPCYFEDYKKSNFEANAWAALLGVTPTLWEPPVEGEVQ
jgi:hypothetical protein